MEHGDNAMTFSVRQLAQMFGRSEQTVRRWKDQGKLTAGLPWEEAQESSGGALVFTADAVRDFVRRNPSVLNRADPRCREILFGSEPGAGAAGRRGHSSAEAIPMSGPTVSRLSAHSLGGSGGYSASEAETDDWKAPEWGEEAPEEEGPSDGSFHRPDFGFFRHEDEENGYLAELLDARDREIDDLREKLHREMDHIREETEKLEEQGGSAYLRRLLNARECELRSQEMELIREHSRLVRERFSREDGPGPYLRQLLLTREETVHRRMEELEEELEVIRKNKEKLGL